MHRPGTEPRPSIYYHYRVFPAFLPTAATRDERRRRVVIVGAGPAGLTAALDLARYGMPCVLLESEQQVSEGKRAMVFTRRSMAILQQVGVADRICAAGLPWRYGNSFSRKETRIRVRPDSTGTAQRAEGSGPRPGGGYIEKWWLRERGPPPTSKGMR
jgi:3-(3-hydroxy-phenyl)propionate hydroxylase